MTSFVVRANYPARTEVIEVDEKVTVKQLKEHVIAKLEVAEEDYKFFNVGYLSDSIPWADLKADSLAKDLKGKCVYLSAAAHIRPQPPKPTVYDFTEAKLHSFMIPSDAKEIKIECWGAQGGANFRNLDLGGKGAYAQGVFSVRGGEALTIIVGSQPTHNPGSTTAGGGGGGGSFAWFTSESKLPLVIAGGGGGMSYEGRPGGPGSDNVLPQSPTGASVHGAYTEGQGGGSCGGHGGGCGAGGGGWEGKGAGNSWASGGEPKGGAGGTSSYVQGGFGSAGAGFHGGGGGGGWTGGNGGTPSTGGDGGGSYVNKRAISKEMKADVQSQNGKVKLSLVLRKRKVVKKK